MHPSDLGIPRSMDGPAGTYRTSIQAGQKKDMVPVLPGTNMLCVQVTWPGTVVGGCTLKEAHPGVQCPAHSLGKSGRS
jgi:hypothetical protein